MTRPLRVLITNHMLAGRSGTELYVFDLAKGLLARGHTPIVFSPRLGPLAKALALATVAVVDDLSRLAAPPDVIHGQHTLETAIALLHFPRTPALYVCHDWSWENDIPPRIPRIRQFVAVDHTVRDRLVLREGIPEGSVAVVNNGVDLARFVPRGLLPAAPRSALVLSNYMTLDQVAVIRAACEARGISVAAVGAHLGQVSSQPEKLIGQYDLVFAKGRCAWESLACGTAVIVCDTWGVGPLITTAGLEFARERNFGRRLLQTPLSEEAIAAQLAHYDAVDAAEVSRRIRATCSLDLMVETLVGLYTKVLEAHQVADPDFTGELRSLSRLLHSWNRCQQPPQIDAVDLRQLLQVEHVSVHKKLDQLALRPRGLRKLLDSLKKRLLPWFSGDAGARSRRAA
jgi:hypothetical protein